MSGLAVLRQVTDRETGARTYETGGLALPSVTTILRTLDKPALRGWYAREAVTEAIRVAELADGAGSGPEVAMLLRERAQDIARAADRTSRNAADRGIRIHEIVRECIANRTPKVAPEHAGYVEAFRAFLDERTPRFVETEVAVINRRVGYAGTADAIATIDGDPDRLVLDWKTCASEAKAAVWPEARLQIAAYRRAEAIVEPSGERRMPRITRGVIVHLWPGGYRLTTVESGPAEFAAFRALLRVWTWTQAQP